MRALVWCGLTALLCACHKETSQATNRKPPVPSTPVPPPAALVAEVSARGPDALWGRLQQGVAGPFAQLPQTVGGALATVARLDLTLAGEIDGAAPAYGVVAHPGATFGWVAAFKLRDLEHARAALLEGKSPRFTGRPGDGELTVLAAAKPDPRARYLVALSPLGYLLVARSEADLVTLAPYATRTLPARPPSPHALVVTATHEALAGAIHDQLDGAAADLRATASMLDATLRQQHGGKAPDLGDPTAIIKALDDWFHAKLALLADLERAELTLDAGDQDVDLELSLTPGKGVSSGAFASLPVGDAAPMLSLSADTEAALLLRDDAPSLADGAKAAEERAVAAFKPALGAKDTAAIHGAFSAWAGSRGPWVTVAAELEGGPAVTIRTPTANPDLAMQSVTDFVDLARLPAFRTMLDSHFAVQGISTATAAATGTGSTSIATFQRKKGAGEVAIAWAMTGDLLHVGAAASSARALRASKDPTALLGSDIGLAGKLGTLHNRVAFVFAGHSDLDHKGSGPRSSLVLGLGRDKGNGWAMLEVDDTIVREALGRWLEP